MECLEIPVVTQGEALEEALKNLQEAVALHLAGEDLDALGFAQDPNILVTMEKHPAMPPKLKSLSGSEVVDIIGYF